ncbi:MAG: hypothetical protein HC820_09025 [Hydrococcus sp. RM1_1_31]|nr:hypothetical protein [Hydrococcus sp. RM1_1_31]
MPSPSGEGDRLLLTYDAGRPYEIDPDSLKVVTPVGSNREWRSAIPIKQPFAAHLSTAHPTYEAFTEEMFTINYGRSVMNLLDTVPFFDRINELPNDVDAILGSVTRFIGRDFLQPLFQQTRQIFEATFGLFEKSIESIVGIDVPNFLYLIRWDGKGDLERWRLVLPNGLPVKIEQSVHQIGVTEDYLIIIDTAFKVGVEQLLNNPLPDSEQIENSLRVLLTRPQSPESNIYIVRRRDLINGQRPAQCDTEVIVTAKKVVLPLESIHFLNDYVNPDGKITLHIAHNCATDVSEVVRSYDESAYQKAIAAFSPRWYAGDRTDGCQPHRTISDRWRNWGNYRLQSYPQRRIYLWRSTVYLSRKGSNRGTHYPNRRHLLAFLGVLGRIDAEIYFRSLQRLQISDAFRRSDAEPS